MGQLAGGILPPAMVADAMPQRKSAYSGRAKRRSLMHLFSHECLQNPVTSSFMFGNQNKVLGPPKALISRYFLLLPRIMMLNGAQQVS